ncbi:MAG: hypothetical protein LCH63_19785 [Candidatus Melainabacteria bacterium]|nr:hypothetical protein [Candidatus Melainabacteria bacterium]
MASFTKAVLGLIGIFEILKDIAEKERKIRVIKEENAWFRPFWRLEAKPRRISFFVFS